MIYLDHNATTPCHPDVLAGMLPFFSEKFGNPSSTTYPLAWQSDEAIRQARTRIAQLVGAQTQEIVFTSGATEACNLAIKGLYDLYQITHPEEKFHIITTAIEHSAVLDTCKNLELVNGAEITYLPVNNDGVIDLKQLEKEIKSNTILIAVMYANNETGVIQDISSISKIAHDRKITFFSDCTQALGKQPCNFRDLGIDMAAFSGHKIYGPKGIGALYISRKNPRVRILEQQSGGGHERGRRSGTLNVPAIVGFGIAAELAFNHREEWMQNIQKLRDELQSQLLQVPNSSINGQVNNKLANVINIAFEGIKADKLISKVNQELCISVGSACNAAENKPSHVLTAMGKSEAQLDGSIRLSLGIENNLEQINQAAEILIKNITSLQKETL